jgi:hypothetical protein
MISSNPANQKRGPGWGSALPGEILDKTKGAKRA